MQLAKQKLHPKTQVFSLYSFPNRHTFPQHVKCFPPCELSSLIFIRLTEDQTYAVYPTSYNVSHTNYNCPCACTVLCDGWSSLCAPSLSDSPTLCPHSALARFLGGFSARGWSSAVTRTALKYALRSLFVIDDVSACVSGSEAVDSAGAGSVSVAVLSPKRLAVRLADNFATTGGQKRTDS